MNNPKNPAKKRIAYGAGSQPPPGSIANVYIMKPDGTHFTRLTEGKFNWNVSWAPDSKIIFFNTIIDSSIKIKKMDINVRKEVLLEKIPSPVFSPKISPDGKYILFSSREGIYYSKIDGVDIKKITSHTGSHNWYPSTFKQSK